MNKLFTILTDALILFATVYTCDPIPALNSNVIMSVWFCCRFHITSNVLSHKQLTTLALGSCGDGPNSGAVMAACNCGHEKCSSCSVEDHDHDYHSASLSAAPSSYKSTPTRSSATRLRAVHTLGLGLGHNHIHRGPRSHGAPVDGPVVFRWTCCKCGGDNSYDYDAGCSYCSDHWRNGCCAVYKVET